MSEMLEERFEIDDDRKAEWAIEKIKEHYADRDRWVAHYDDLKEKAIQECDEHVAGLKFMLRRYLADRSAAGFTKATKTQETYPLPSGKLILKKQGPEYEHDDSVLVPWLEENAPEFVKVKKSADWAELKKVVAISGEGVVNEDGEVVPGVKVIERDEKFDVQIKE